MPGPSAGRRVGSSMAGYTANAAERRMRQYAHEEVNTRAQGHPVVSGQYTGPPDGGW